MDDLPPPIKIATDSSDTPNPIELPTPKVLNTFQQIIKFIVKIKWSRVSAYIVGFVGVVSLLLSLPTTRNWIEKSFPNSSPIFGREISVQGVLKSSNTGLYTLVLPDQQSYILHLKPTSTLSHLKNIKEAVVKGNLTWASYVIESAEIYPLNFVTSDDPDPSPSPLTSLNSSNTPKSPNSLKIPDLFPGLTWETSQKRVLIFTSGKRKIEQEGTYVQSARLATFPQDFINYYIEGLKGASFKETLNSISPEGITITYAKDDTFLTFGIKNIYSGSASNKKLSGYQAFIEHN